MTDLTLMPLSPADHADMAALYAFSVANNPQGFIQKLSFHGDIVETAQNWVTAGGDMQVAKLGGTLVGMGALRPVDGTRVELCKLHLHPDHHGKGLGKTMSLHLLTRARELGFKVVELHVTETQQAAIGLYRRLGFTETKRDVWTTEIDGQALSFPTLYMEKAL
ncbi:MAG: GNAT family N-acetyltransferase [Proteobacteria bacterium]|nr:GNAT family N-acetyltransferase [Pseudomonadota bacterium]